MSESSLNPTRREAIQTAGVLTAGALAGVAIPSVHAAGDEEIQVALVGCGGRGTGAAENALRTTGPVKLVAMADVFKERLEGSYRSLKGGFDKQVTVPADKKFIGFDGYKQAMDSLKKGDVVILTTPPAFRWVHFKYAIEKGLNVFMEKPTTVDGPSTRRMLELADKSEKAGLKVGVGLMCRHCDARKALYEQIKALTEQKRFAEAAALAQQGYSDKTLERLKAVEGDLGYIDRMWRGITGTAREAWDAMRGVGRQTTLQEELRSVQQQLANNRMRGFGDVALPGLGPSPNEALRERESVLQSELRLQQMAADRQAQEAAAVRDRIAEDKDKPGTGSARRRPDAWEYGPPSSLQWRPAQPRFQEGAFERDEISMEERGAAWQRHRDQMVQTAMSTAQQMREANDLEDAYAIRSAEARGRAIIAIEEAQARSRIDLNVLTGDQRMQVEEEFARWRVARERQLTEDLKPEWQRMVESWADATALMQRTFDQSVAGSLRIGEDAFVSFVTTGKASIKDLTDFLIEQSVRMAYRNVAVQALAFLFGGSDYAGTAPGGGYTGFEFGGRRAAGGDVRRGRSYWVGENGPELLSMGDEGGWITSNERLRAAMGGGGGGATGVVAVTLNNQSGQALQVGGTSLSEDGQLEVLLLAVDDFMADRVSSGIGKFPSALGSAYGLRRSFGSV